MVGQPYNEAPNLAADARFFMRSFLVAARTLVQSVTGGRLVVTSSLNLAMPAMPLIPLSTAVAEGSLVRELQPSA